MLIILLDEPGLFVFPTPADAVREIEAVDAESEIRAAFDATGAPYLVEWVRPNQRRKRLCGLIESVENGEYRFVPAGPPDRGALRRLIELHPDHTNPPEAQSELAALLRELPNSE